MERSDLSSLRVRMFLLVLLAVIPMIGLMLYTGSEQRRVAAAEVQENALRLARIISRLDLMPLNQLAAEIQLPRGAAVMLVDRSGTVLDRYPDAERWLGQMVPEGPIIQTLRARQGEGVVETAGVDGIRRVYAYSPLRGAGAGGNAFVSVGIPTAVAFAEANWMLAHNLGGLGFVALLSLAVAWVGTDLFLVRRMKALVSAAHRLGGGDLSARAGLPHGRWELGQLARAFDEMATALQTRQAEVERAEEVRAQLAAIVDSSDDAIIGRTLDGIITSWNPAAEQLYGYSAEEVKGRPISILVPPDHPDELPEILERLRSGERINHYETTRIRKDGRRLEVSVTISPIRDSSGRIIGSSAIARDISDRKRVEDEIHRLNEVLEQHVAERTAALEETVADLEAFTYSVSHDLRAPLRAMQGFTQALLEDYTTQLDPVGQDYAHRIGVAAARMETLIQDLLAYSRLSRAELPLRPVALAAVVAEVLAHLEVAIQTREARVTVEEPLPAVLGHHITLRQVVTNLLTNAVTFVAPGVPPRVRIWAEAREAWVRLWLEDNGIGIAREHQDHIFRMFERLHGLDTYPGTGIGLAIVRKGMERMGGEVGVESAVGQGSRFWVELPHAENQP